MCARAQSSPTDRVSRLGTDDGRASFVFLFLLVRERRRAAHANNERFERGVTVFRSPGLAETNITVRTPKNLATRARDNSVPTYNVPRGVRRIARDYLRHAFSAS